MKLILVTSAPKVWQQQVTKYLGIEQFFESIYTGEDFKTKTELFQMLSRRYQPGNITSVGDQDITDIQPAIRFGIKGFLVNSPEDLENIRI